MLCGTKARCYSLFIRLPLLIKIPELQALISPFTINAGIKSKRHWVGEKITSEFDVGDSLLCEESWATSSREGVHKQDHELSIQP